jgi:hypothetical protein
MTNHWDIIEVSEVLSMFKMLYFSLPFLHLFYEPFSFCTHFGDPYIQFERGLFTEKRDIFVDLTVFTCYLEIFRNRYRFYQDISG